jgi:predicted ATPase
MNDPTFLTRVRLKNYRSIAACDVRLGALRFLVGPNGSGKSNFVDALRLVADSLNTTLDHALRDRGGIQEVRRRSGGHPTHFAVTLDFQIRNGRAGSFSFRVGARSGGGYEVQREELRLRQLMQDDDYYVVESGRIIESSVQSPPAAAPDRLYLVNVSGLPQFRPAYESFSHMGFYNLNPDRIRDLQSPAAADILARDGSNLTSVLRQLETHSPEMKRRIEGFLSKVVPGIEAAEVRSFGPKETIEFRQRVGANPHPWRFLAASMSDGTLRALGNLVALFQFANGRQQLGSLVGIEEPETALHPAAAGILRDGLRDASENTQVIVTSHSPDLLDDASIAADEVLAVTAEAGATRIGPLDDAARSALRDRLYTAGELLRLGQLRSDPTASGQSDEEESQLFPPAEEK